MLYVNEDKIDAAIEYYGVPFSTKNNFRLDNTYIYESKDYLVVDEDTNIYIIISRFNTCIKCKYILTMLNKLTNELVTNNEVIVPIKAFITFFELYKYLPISFDTFLYYKDDSTDYKDYNTFYMPRQINNKLLIINLPLIYYAYASYVHNNEHALSLLWHLLEYSYYKFDALRIMLDYKPKYSSIDKLLANKQFLNQKFKIARERLLTEFYVNAK